MDPYGIAEVKIEGSQISCYYLKDEIEYKSKDCQYFSGLPEYFKWIPSERGRLEKCAVIFKDKAVGRANFQNIFKVGSIHKNNLFVAYNGKSKRVRNYEALVYLDPAGCPDTTTGKFLLLLNQFSHLSIFSF